MECILRVDGAEFDVDRFVANSRLVPSKVWHKGSLRVHPDGTQSTRHASGMNVLVSSTADSDFSRLQMDAATFLRSHASELNVLMSLVGAEGAELDFGIFLKPDTVMHTYRFAPDVVHVATELRIVLSVSVYVTS